MSRAVAAAFAALITSADNGDGDQFGPILSVLSMARSIGFTTRGLYNGNCTEEIPFATQDSSDDVLEDEEIRPALLADDAFPVLPLFSAACGTWDTTAADPVESDPVTSDVPTLVASG